MKQGIMRAAWLAVAGFSVCGWAQEAVKPAPDFTLKDIAGAEHSLAASKGSYVVLEWTNFDCPFVRKHYETDNMQALQKTYTEKGVIWLTICSSAPNKQGHLTPEQWAERVTQYKAVPTALLLDADGKVGKLYGAKTTPQMVIINPEGNVIYTGAIDDQPKLEREKMKDAVNYVKQTLDAAMADKPVEVSATAPYGCSVKY
ncbi:MAG: thioredoxin family protein [Lentisphaerae bacterium]|nr:thioredoxin family protein [Lentisphaerota bacterium]